MEFDQKKLKGFFPLDRGRGLEWTLVSALSFGLRAIIPRTGETVVTMENAGRRKVLVIAFTKCTVCPRLDEQGECIPPAECRVGGALRPGIDKGEVWGIERALLRLPRELTFARPTSVTEGLTAIESFAADDAQAPAVIVARDETMAIAFRDYAGWLVDAEQWTFVPLGTVDKG